MPMIGEFRCIGKDGIKLLIHGPRDLAEAKAGVPQAAFALRNGEQDQENLVQFLNAAVSVSHGDFEPMNKLCQPKT